CSRHFVRSEPVYQKLQMDSSLPPDTAFVAYYAPYKQQLDAELDRVIGHSAVHLTKPGSAPETVLGNLAPEALLAEGRSSDPRVHFYFGAEGDLRTELPKREHPVDHLFELLQYEDELLILELSAQKVNELAEYVAGTQGQPVAGLQLVI